ncbi:MAG: hypothetical protein GY700_05160, partial [Propionibacteriaceae bacterium]|nr:hypothetical protein [Propionibacteriaceae bacterium]
MRVTQGCGHFGHSTEGGTHSLDLYLTEAHVSPVSRTTVSSLLTEFLASASVMSKCETCFADVPHHERGNYPDSESLNHTRMALLEGSRPPPTLFVHVNRVSFAPDGGSNRIEGRVQADPLTITYYAPYRDGDTDPDGAVVATATYAPTGVIDHLAAQGVSTGGHYTTTLLEQDEKWYKFDDASVSMAAPPPALGPAGS